MSKSKVMSGEGQEPPSFEDVLEELGTPGRFQMSQIMVIFSSATLTAFMAMGFIFQAYSPPYVCNHVNNTDLLLSSYDLRHNATTDVIYNSCDVTIVVNDTNSGGKMREVARLSCPNGRNFSDAKHTTWVTEWDLVCESQGLAELSYSMLTGGQILGGIVASYLTDRFGRRPIYLAVSIGAWLVETTIIFAPNIYFIIGMRFIAGFFHKAIVSCGFVYAMEFVVPRQRQVFGPCSAMLWVYGVLVVAATGYIFQDSNWQYFQGASAVCGLYFILAFLFLHESPRWLAANNKIDEALKVLKVASRRNGKDFSVVKKKFLAYVDHTFAFSPSDLEALVPLGQIGVGETPKACLESAKRKDNSDGVEKVSVMTLLKNKSVFVITMITTYIWLTHVMTYYGLYMTSTKLAGNRFLNFTLMILVEIPSSFSVFLLLKVLGRRAGIAVFLAITGASLMTSTMLFTLGQHLEGSGIASTILFILGKWAISSSFVIIYVLTPELFPTNLRSTASGLCNSLSRVGSMVAPFMTLLFDMANWGPSCIFTVMCVAGVILIWYLPETKGVQLPNTVGEMMEQRKRRQKK